MSDETARDIYNRLNAIDNKLATLTGALSEREKTCSVRHLSLDNVCTLAQQLKGGWKAAAIIGAAVGAVVGPLITRLLTGGHG